MKALDSKSSIPLRVSGVRIPLSPPEIFRGAVMKTVIIVQARMTSTRLFGKVLKNEIVTGNTELCYQDGILGIHDDKAQKRI